MRDNRLFIVVPCYNEEAALPQCANKLQAKMEVMISQGLVASDSRIIFVDDGSQDQTWALIQALHEENPRFLGLKLSRNRGHQNALLAGLMTVREQADMVISIDADLQDDIDAMDEMIAHYQDGCEIVFGVRSSRATDTPFKRSTAQAYYKVLNLLGAEVVYNHADYRLMSRTALAGLSEFYEVNLYLRGIVLQLGYQTAQVSYERKERTAGESKYPLKKMLGLAWEGITSFSIKPIRLVTVCGIAVAAIAFVCLIWSLIAKFSGSSVDGWSSLMASIWLVGGLQILGIGIIGEYIGKIYLESKHRPRFIIEAYLCDESNARVEV